MSKGELRGRILRRSGMSKRVAMPVLVVFLWAWVAVVVAPVTLANPASLYSYSGVIFYYAGGGEQNDVTFTYAGATYNVTDPGATISASFGCTSTGPNSATCPAAGVRSIYAELEDLNDRATAIVPVETNLYGEAGNDVLTGGSARDLLYGGPGDDTLSGADGADYLQGEDGNDALNGDAGGDQLRGGVGNDEYRGGTESDTSYYSERSGDVTVSLDDNSGDGETATGESDNVHSDVENVYAGEGNDTITGSALANDLSGNFGNDSISGLGGNDYLSGDEDDDVLNGGKGDDTFSQEPGSDTYAGGAGSDFIEYYTDDNVTVRLNGTADDGAPGEGDNVRSDVEEILTGGGNDTLVGNNGANEFTAGAGSDILKGGGGSDGLNGERGSDRITGGGGVDSANGGPGGDTIALKDKSKDYAECGAGVDKVRRDRRDYAERDCERIRS